MRTRLKNNAKFVFMRLLKIKKTFVIYQGISSPCFRIIVQIKGTTRPMQIMVVRGSNITGASPVAKYFRPSLIIVKVHLVKNLACSYLGTLISNLPHARLYFVFFSGEIRTQKLVEMSQLYIRACGLGIQL